MDADGAFCLGAFCMDDERAVGIICGRGAPLNISKAIVTVEEAINDVTKDNPMLQLFATLAKTGDLAQFAEMKRIEGEPFIFTE